MDQAERNLIAAVRRVKALDAALAERDERIREALVADVPRHRISAISELSTQRIDQIRHKAR
jgi:hypothetical protein